jgi:hypothetical protein
MRIEKWVAGLGFMGLLSSASASASAQSAGWNAAGICNPQNSTHAARLTYSDFGVYNTSTTSTAEVHCSVAPQVSAISQILVIVYDGNSGTGSSANVSCSARVQNGTGSTIWSGGSLSTTGSSSSALPLSWNPPANTIGLVHVSCTLPAKAPNSSYVTSIFAV